VKKLAELIEKYRVTLMIATPTFLRGYLRGVNREALASIKLCVTGAEKLPSHRGVSDAFETRFGKRVLEGYGLTETSPVSNVNLPDPEPSATKTGYVLAAQPPSGFRRSDHCPAWPSASPNPETGAAQSRCISSGMIWFKGPTSFEGYLNDPKRTADVLQDGWFRTGDIGRVDLDGFLYIEGPPQPLLQDRR
jgi:acyl-[acyl-carrier-protein]-phospholipid O-acyltransferase/long-chain-fatty-acid--[acyl-carrier-protein] ligase